MSQPQLTLGFHSSKTLYGRSLLWQSRLGTHLVQHAVLHVSERVPGAANAHKAEIPSQSHWDGLKSPIHTSTEQSFGNVYPREKQYIGFLRLLLLIGRKWFQRYLKKLSARHSGSSMCPKTTHNRRGIRSLNSLHSVRPSTERDRAL